MALVTIEMVKAAFLEVSKGTSIEESNHLLGVHLTPLFNMSDSGGGGGAVTKVTGAGQIVATPSTGIGEVVLSHANSGVLAGTYGSGTQIPVLTVDAAGHLTLASTSPVTAPSSFPWANLTGVPSVVAGNGLSGGGQLLGSVTLSVNFAGSGIANTVSRSDHRHDLEYVALDGSNSPMTGPLSGIRFEGQNPAGGSGAGLITRGAVAWYDYSRPVNEKYWDVIHDAVTGKLKIRAVNDIGSSSTTAMEFTRSGSTVTGASVLVPLTGSSFIKSGGTASQFLKADGSVDATAYATAGSLGNYVLKTGDAMSGGLSIGIAGTTPYPLGPYVPLSVSGNDYSSIVVKSTSAARTAAIAFNTASTSGTSWAIGKRDDGNNGTPIGSLAIWDDTLARFWMTPTLASYRVNLETTAELRYSGGVFRDLTPNTAYTAFYPSGVTPAGSPNYNYGLAFLKTGAEGWLNGTTSSHLGVNGTFIVRAKSTGAEVAGTLSSTGHLTAPSATIGSSTAMLKRVAGALTDAVAGTDYLPPPAVGGNASLFLRGDGVWSNTLAGSGASLTIHAASISSDHTNNWVTHNVAIDAWGHSFQGNGTSLLTLMPGSVKLPGCTFRNDVFDPLVYAIYGSAVATPSNTNGSVYIGKDGGITSINGASLSALLVGGSIRVAANSAGAQVTGTLSSTGGFASPSAIIGSSTAMLKRVSGALTDAVSGVDYIVDMVTNRLRWRNDVADTNYLSIYKQVYGGYQSTFIDQAGGNSEVRLRCDDGFGTFIDAVHCRAASVTVNPILTANGGFFAVGLSTVESIDISSGVMKFRRIVVATATYVLPTVAAEETIQIIFNVTSCAVSTSSQSVSFRDDSGAKRDAGSGGFDLNDSYPTTFGRSGAKNRSILLTGITSVAASITN